MIRFLFLDLDDTILDFQKAEYIALGKTLEKFGLEPTEQVRSRYSRINREYWQRLERKELTRERVLVGRFETLFEQEGLNVQPAEAAAEYEANLSVGHYFLPGAEKALSQLAEKYKLYLASNGTAAVQAGRLKSANISRYFREIFISQEMGACKPDPRYFQACFDKIPGFNPREAMIAGDSLTSDILGGIRAGMLTCWINTLSQPPRADICPDYELESLEQLPGLLESLS